MKHPADAATKSHLSVWACLALAASTGCVSRGGTPSDSSFRQTVPASGPYVLVLGTAQDGGLPQIGCRRACCLTAHDDESLKRRVTSLLLVDPASGKRWLFDATPHLPSQVKLAESHGGPSPDVQGRPPLFDGIFITHAHLGHYAGLAFMGREAYGSRGTKVYGTPKLLGYLMSNGPWSLMFADGFLWPSTIVPGEAVALTDTISVTALEVPHRDEFSDTVAFLIEAPGASLLYLPDIDKWERWDTQIEDVIARVDFALLDGTFYGPDELPGRDMSEVPHPFIVESTERFGPLPDAEKRKIIFTHLNHSNAAAMPGSDEARAVRAAGFGILADGDVIPLGQ